MSDDTTTPPWLLDDDDPVAPPGLPRPRRSLLLVGALVPWIVVLALVLRNAPEGTPPPSQADLAPMVRPTTSATTSPSPSPPSAAQPTVSILASGARMVPTAADAAALAVVVARSWLTGVGPRLVDAPPPGIADRYVEHIAVEGVDRPAAGHVVVSLLAVLLTVADGAYDGVEVRRIAVPLSVDRDRVRPAGSPWWLAEPDLRTDAPATTPVDDPESLVAAGTAVAEAGYADVDVVALARTAGWPWIADVDAIAPGTDAATRHRIWLRPHVDGFVVAGALPPRPDVDATAAEAAP